MANRAKISLDPSGYGYPGFAKAWGIQWTGSASGTNNHIDLLVPVPYGGNREEARTHWRNHLEGAIFQAHNYDNRYGSSPLSLTDTRLALGELRGIRSGSTTIDNGSGTPLSWE